MIVEDKDAWTPLEWSGDINRIYDGEEEFITWSFGKGEEGVRVPKGSRSEVKAVIVDSSFPWWFSSAKSVDVIVTKVWLTLPLLVGCQTRGLIETWCNGTDVEVGPTPSKGFIKAMMSSNLLLVGGRVPDILVKKGLWNSTVQCVMATTGGRNKCPRPWRNIVSEISHVTLGGVTDGVFGTACDSQIHTFSARDIWSTPQLLRKDLRWVLKGGEVGVPVSKGIAATERGGNGKVNYVNGSDISECSLLPVSNPDVLIHTVFRHDTWVKRRLTTYERLLAWDVPERLIKTLKDENDRQLLLTSLHTPVKVLQLYVEHVVASIRNHLDGMNQQEEGVKRKYHESVPQLSNKKRCFKYGTIDGRKLTTIHEVEEVTDQRSDATNKIDVENIFKKDAEVNKALDQVDRNLVATKGDSATVPIELWDKYLDLVVPGIVNHHKFERAAKYVRSWLLSKWKRNVTSSYCKWENQLIVEGADQSMININRTAALECLSKVGHATWWSWDQGSRPLFWRWPKDYQSVVRDGVHLWYNGPQLRWIQKQKSPGSKELVGIIHKKLENIREKGYVEGGQIDSLMSYFNVPKGKDDVRMVYDGSKSGLNDRLWAPWFPLPTIDWSIRALKPGYFMADNDVGEMFHNFMLDENIRKFCGLDLSVYFKDDKTALYDKMGRYWRRWNRLAMGLRPSPYCAVQGMMIAKEVILGDQYDVKNNVFHWETVRLNLPGNSDYDPSEAWVSKMRHDGGVAADVFIYVDDIRSCAPTELEAWHSSQRTSTKLAFLGIQDATRKRRQPGSEAGAWTGSVVWTSNNQIVVLVTQDRWDKVKSKLQWIVDHIDDACGLNGKTLQSIRGFLVYVSRTYTSMVPYLKGIHATIDSWRPNRNIDGWAYPGPRDQWLDDEIDDWCDDCDSDSDSGEGGSALDGIEKEKPEVREPMFVMPVPRLRGDLQSLLQLTNSDKPPLRRVRMSKTAKVVYGFGDASKQGFGSTIVTPDQAIHWTAGHWTLEEEQRNLQSGEGPTLIQERSSNYRELRNLVQELEKAFDKGLLDDREVFMFTDNSTAESAYFKGSSKSELLFGLVLRVRKIEMSGRCKIHMVHVAGTRMIWQGTDGLSRGDRNAGVMAGESMLSFIPLHKNAMERSSRVLTWITEWASEDESRPLKVLHHNDWPKNLITESTYVWAPPPAAADVAAEFMAQTIHKRHTSTHIFICPRLMTARWMRFIIKASDVVFVIPVGCNIWEADQHEPLIFALSFPLSSVYPWKQRNFPQFDRTAKEVQSVLTEDFTRSGIILREFVVQSRIRRGGKVDGM